MAAKNVDINIRTKADVAGAKQAAKEMSALATAAEQADSRTTKSAGKAGSKKAQIAAQVGMQVQDIAVQAQMGVKATTILAQQGSQLLGVFGPYGAIAGGILAIGAAATGVFMKMGDDTATAKEKADFLADAIDKIAEKAGKLESEKIDMGRDAIKEAIELTKLLAEGYNIASNNERLFSNQAMQGLLNLKQVEIELRKLKGGYTDEQANLDTVKVKNEAILLQANQQKEAEMEKIKLANEAAIIAQQEVERTALLLAQKEQLLNTEIKQLDALRERKKELEKVSKETTSVNPNGSFGIIQPTQEATSAKQELESRPFEAEIKALDERINKIAEAVNGQLASDLKTAAESAQKAQIAVDNITAEVAGTIERIDFKSQEDYIIGKKNELEAQATVNADLLRTTFEGLTPVNEAQRQGLQTIQSVLKDNQILADETGSVSVAVQQVTSSATTAQNINLQNVNQLLQLMNSYGAQLQRQGKEIEKLKGRYLSPKKAN